MKRQRTKLVIPGMCEEGPPPYAELESDDRVRIRREVALSKVEEDGTYCVHFSSIREILTSQKLENKVSHYPAGYTSSTSTKSRRHTPRPQKPLAQEDGH